MSGYSEALSTDNTLLTCIVRFPNLTRAYGNNGRRPRRKCVSDILQFGFPVLTRAYDNNGRRRRQKLVFGILQLVGWFPNLARAYGYNGRRPRQKFVFGILQLMLRKTRVMMENQSLKIE